MKIDVDTARSIASEFLRDYAPAGMTLVILDKYTIVRESCYVFCYDTDRHLKTNDLEDCLIGNMPVIVDALSGWVQFFEALEPLDAYLDDYDRSARARNG